MITLKFEDGELITDKFSIGRNNINWEKGQWIEFAPSPSAPEWYQKVAGKTVKVVKKEIRYKYATSGFVIGLLEEVTYYIKELYDSDYC